MKKHVLFAFIFISLGISSRGNYSIDWVGMPDILNNSGTSIARDDSNNVFTTTSDGGKIYLEKRDRFGNFQWQRISSTTIALNYEYPSRVFADPQGNAVVVGYRYTHSSSGNNANAILILKYDPAGLMIYKKEYIGSYSYFNNSRYWTNVSSVMDAGGYLYIGTAGNVGSQPDWGFNAIKVNPSGNIERVSTKPFASATNFLFVTRIRLRDNMIGLTGVTSYSTANATTWVLDTAGNDLWNNISPGEQGKDIAFDAAGNAFMLTWVAVSLVGDVSITKFDVAGNQLWNKLFDFGGSDLSSQMEWTPDGNLAVMAYANSAPGGSFYVDWVTFKCDTSGTLLWSDRYDEHSSNDEYPGMMAIDATGNIYVTGIGGPFPGGSNLGKRQMVTVKYTPAGIREWTSAIDTINEYMTGVGIVIGNDSSIFVLGDVKTFIVHYLDHTGSAPCTPPSLVSLVSVTDSSATINWSPVANAYLYHLQFKTSASLTWESRSTNAISITVDGLFSGTIYDYRVEAICNSGPTGYTLPQQFTTTGSGYCPSMGTNAAHEWIDLVFINNLLNSTPDTDSGYADYTFLSTDVAPGGSYDITLSAAMDASGPYNENWKVWIDFNRNNDFSDPGEEVVSYSSTQIGWETHTFQIPAGISLGTTIMRVSMKNGVAQTPCEIFSLGEVEDYTVNITGTTSISTLSNDVDGIRLFPNPASSALTLLFSGEQISSSFEIIDFSGRKFLEGAFENTRSISINIQNLVSGAYLIRMLDEAGRMKVIKWMKQ